MSASATLSRSGTSPGARSGANRRRPRRRRWGLFVVAVLVVLLLATAGWLVAFSSVFATRDVQITGTKDLSIAEVSAAAQVPLGKPLARQELQAIATRVGSLATVRFVHVRRHWPRSVVISVQERVPVLAVRQPQGLILVDAGGIAYRTVSSVPTGVVLAEVDPSNATLLAQVGVVAQALPRGLQAKITSIQAPSVDGIRLAMKDGDTVVWGSSDDSVLKAQVLVALLKHRASSYDVSAPHNPSLR